MPKTCTECEGLVDTRNQLYDFCTDCAAVTDKVTGALYNSYGQFVRNVVSDQTESK